MNKTNFIIMTTAIIRPDLHKISLKKFYEMYYYNYKKYVDENFDIYHIINVDSPEKLKQHFTREQTVENLKSLVPPEVHLELIVTHKPSFAGAFKNIMDKVKELSLLDIKNYYFWFEDDWVSTRNINLFQYIKHFMIFKCCAMTNTYNAQCGSFRGGPIMNGTFFTRYFNLVNLGLFSTNKDPERQVRRYIGKYQNFSNNLKEDRDKKIKLLQINEFMQKHMDDFGTYFYQTRYNKSIVYEKHIVLYKNNELFYLDCTNQSQYIMINPKKYTNINYFQLLEKIDGDSIVYINLKPYNFEDCGREFNNNYGLEKAIS